MYVKLLAWLYDRAINAGSGYFIMFESCSLRLWWARKMRDSTLDTEQSSISAISP